MVVEPVKHEGRIDVAATGACLGALCCWSIGPIFIKYLTGHIDSWTQNALRYSVACGFWLPFLLHSIKRGSFDRRTWSRSLGPAVTNLVMQSLWAKAFYYGGPAFLVLLSKTSILWVAGFSLLFFRDERPLAKSLRFWAGLALSVVGLFGVLYFKGDFEATGATTGIIIVLFGALLWGGYTISIKIAFRNTDSRSGFSVISIYTTVGLWIAAWVFGEPAQAMLVILVQPLAVVGLSGVAFGEQLNALQGAFGLVLLAGAALSVWAQQHLKNRR